MYVGNQSDKEPAARRKAGQVVLPADGMVAVVKLGWRMKGKRGGLSREMSTTRPLSFPRLRCPTARPDRVSRRSLGSRWRAVQCALYSSTSHIDVRTYYCVVLQGPCVQTDTPQTALYVCIVCTLLHTCAGRRIPNDQKGAPRLQASTRHGANWAVAGSLCESPANARLHRAVNFAFSRRGVRKRQRQRPARPALLAFLLSCFLT